MTAIKLVIPSRSQSPYIVRSRPCGRDVLTDVSVTTRGALDKEAVLVVEHDGQAVELRLDYVGDLTVLLAALFITFLDADEVFLTGTGAELIPVVKIDGRTIGTGRPGPVTRELARVFGQNIRTFARVHNTITKEKEIVDRWRKMPTPQTGRHLSNDVEPEVVEARADKGEDFLRAMLDSDAGARYVGEFAIGTNKGITRFTRQILFDEKINGSFHMALGAGYPETGSKNESAIHWDMICDLRDGGEILPLAALLERPELREMRVIEAELEREYGRVVYELEILSQDGRVYERYFDATTGEPLD